MLFKAALLFPKVVEVIKGTFFCSTARLSKVKRPVERIIMSLKTRLPVALRATRKSLFLTASYITVVGRRYDQ